MSKSILPGPKTKMAKKFYDTLLFGTVVAVLLISFMGVIYPTNTYIQCGDPFISHGFFKDTISISTLLSVSLIAPFFMLLIFEWINYVRRPIPNPLSRAFRRTYTLFSYYFVGNLFGLFIVEILKTAVSEPRPHFMSSCKPNLTDELCKNQWIHITWENCTNPLSLSHLKLLDTMKSFPSGHASISIFSAVFITMYIEERVKVSWSSLLPMWLNMVWWSWALICSASRVWDKKHHWWDVLFGGVIGIVLAYATVKCACRSFRERDRCSISEEKFTSEKGSESVEQKTTFKKQPVSNTELKGTINSQSSVSKS